MDKRGKPWKGIDANERLIHSVRNAIVSVYLDGVQGISTPVPGNEWRLLDASKAQGYVERARAVLADLESQRVPRSAQSWTRTNVEAFRGLLSKAEAVLAGGPQRQTAESYAELRRSLGLRS